MRKEINTNQGSLIKIQNMKGIKKRLRILNSLKEIKNIKNFD